MRVGDAAGVLAFWAKAGRSGRVAAAPVNSADFLMKLRRERGFFIR